MRLLQTSVTSNRNYIYKFAVFLWHFLAIFSFTQSWQHAKKVDNFINGVIKCGQIPGLSLAIVQHNKVVVVKGYGYADKEHLKPATKDTKFLIASLTKAFTSALLAELLNKTSLTWQTRVRDIIGEGFFIGDKYISENLNLVDLLAHRTGFPASDILWLSEKFTLKQLIRQMRHLKPIMPFRTGLAYNNLMFILAGHLAELIGGDTWQNLISKYLLKPLNMTNTVSVQMANGNDNFARSYQNSKDGKRQNPHPWKALRSQAEARSAASLCSTAEDMAKWLLFHLKKSKVDPLDTRLHTDVYRGHNVLPYEWTPPVIANETFSIYNYGLGWFTGSYKGYRSLSHYGWLLNFYSYINVFLDEDFAIFTSINGNGKDNWSGHTRFIHDYISDLMLGRKSKLTTNVACEENNQKSQAAHVAKRKSGRYTSNPKNSLDEYEGIYTNLLYGNLTIFVDGNMRRLRLKYGNVRLYLTNSHDKDIFVLIPENRLLSFFCLNDDVVIFHRFKDGKLKSLEIPCFDKHNSIFYRGSVPLEKDEIDNNAFGPRTCAVSSQSAETKIPITGILEILICAAIFI